MTAVTFDVGLSSAQGQPRGGSGNHGADSDDAVDDIAFNYVDAMEE